MDPNLTSSVAVPRMLIGTDGSVYRLQSGRRRHLSASDVFIWDRFLDRHRDWVEWCAYDVRLSGPDGAENKALTPEERGWLTLRQKRCDVIVSTVEMVFVVEIKERLNFAALGQAFGYTSMLRRLAPASVKLQGVVCCLESDEDLETVCQELGVQIWLA